MPGSGTHTFLEPDHYEASVRRAEIELIITCGAGFNARLTCAELHQLRLLRCEEGLPRIGYVTFPSQLACISFPANSDPLPKWRGAEMQAGDIMLHSLGDRLHQTTQGPSIWNLITLDPAELDHYGRTLFEKPLPPPPEGRVLRPSKRDAARLRRLHALACRLAETKPKILAHPGVARAIEQDLIHALVTCLTAARVNEKGVVKRDHALVMIRFEEVLAEHLSRPLHMAELCELVGVGTRTLRACCAEFLGISATRYVLLRRLRETYRALRDADASMVNMSELARRYGFPELERFARAYSAVFSESPSATLRRAPKRRFAAQ
jgi:AraC-like DNA-binding protein